MNTLAQAIAGLFALIGPTTAAEGLTTQGVAESTVSASDEAYAKFNGSRAGEEREFELAPGVRMKFCWCPAGEFVMGSPKSEEGRDSRDEDQARVTLTKGFWIAKTELTQAQWEAVMGSNPAFQKGPDRPAVAVSWNDAQQFMEKINATIGDADEGTMSLPTEAQYEYARGRARKGCIPVAASMRWRGTRATARRHSLLARRR